MKGNSCITQQVILDYIPTNSPSYHHASLPPAIQPLPCYHPQYPAIHSQCHHHPSYTMHEILAGIPPHRGQPPPFIYSPPHRTPTLMPPPSHQVCQYEVLFMNFASGIDSSYLPAPGCTHKAWDS